MPRVRHPPEGVPPTVMELQPRTSDEVPYGPGHENLATVRQRIDSGRNVHTDSAHAVAALLDLGRVETDPNWHLSRFQNVTKSRRAAECPSWRREQRQHAVARVLDDFATRASHLA